MAKKQKPDYAKFEPELKKLEEAVASLESRDLTLEEAFQKLAVGCASYTICREILSEAKSRVETLVKSFPEGEPAWEPFSSEALEETDEE